jgi:ABC-2 type transport system permease protein
MKNITAAFITECMKLRRSGIFWITIALFIFIPLMMGLMMFVARHPEIAAKLGLIGTKSTIFGNNDWPGFMGLLTQSIAAIGYIGFGFVTSWVFGHEYTDHTIKDILALPVTRTSIVVSKFFVIILWCALLAVILYGVGFLTGQFIGLSGWSEKLFAQFTGKYFMTSFLTLLLCTPVAFFACSGRGVIAPLGFVIITLIMAQFMGLVGLGPYFPWSIPGVATAASGTEGMQIVLSSYIILAVTCLAGLAGTLAWWRFADQK